MPAHLAATVTKTYRWQTDGVKLAVTGNYGTPLSEIIRARDEESMAYRLFNLMRSSGKELDYNIARPEYKGEDKKSLKKIDIKYAAGQMGIDIQKEENFASRYAGGKLWHFNWSGDRLRLTSGNVAAYSSTEIYTFCGFRGENIVINRGGTLYYLSEIEWLPVPALEGYTAGKVRWLSENEIVVFAQDQKTGQDFLVITSIRKNNAEFIPAPAGEFKDVIVSENRNQIYASSFYGGVYEISIYIEDEINWEVKKKTSKELKLLAVKDGKVIWFSAGTKTINISGEEEIEGCNIYEIVTYPWGDYILTEDDSAISEPETAKTSIIFYDSQAGRKLKEYGIPDIGVYGIDSDIWLLPEKYRKAIEKLPGHPGSVSLNSEDKTVYYDMPGRDGLREIESMELGSLRIPLAAGAAFFLIIIVVILLKRKE